MKVRYFFEGNEGYEALQKKGLSIRKAAKECNVSPTYMHEIITGEKGMDLNMRLYLTNDGVGH